jgi:hypothetical protein
MPLLAIVNFLIAIYFGVHAVRSGRNMYWLMILLMAPFLGSLIYFFAEYLPEMRHSRVARKAVGTVAKLVDPNRALREAQMAFDRTPTVDNRYRLAEALLDTGRIDDALAHFETCVAGPYAKDLKLRRGLARAQIAAGRHAAAVQTLESLFADAPAEARGVASLWLAQSLSQVDEERAIAAFDEACQLHATTETHCAYGLYLAKLGRTVPARAMLERVLHDARVGTATSRELNRVAIDQARAALKALDARGAGAA